MHFIINIAPKRKKHCNIQQMVLEEPNNIFFRESSYEIFEDNKLFLDFLTLELQKFIFDNWSQALYEVHAFELFFLENRFLHILNLDEIMMKYESDQII